MGDTMTGLDAINEFLQKWPDADFGPAHVVVSDYNLENSNIDFAMRETSREFVNVFYGFPGNTATYHSVMELMDTLGLLIELYDMPEDQRWEGID